MIEGLRPWDVDAGINAYLARSPNEGGEAFETRRPPCDHKRIHLEQSPHRGGRGFLHKDWENRGRVPEAQGLQTFGSLVSEATLARRGAETAAAV